MLARWVLIISEARNDIRDDWFKTTFGINLGFTIKASLFYLSARFLGIYLKSFLVFYCVCSGVPLISCLLWLTLSFRLLNKFAVLLWMVYSPFWSASEYLCFALVRLTVSLICEDFTELFLWFVFPSSISIFLLLLSSREIRIFPEIWF